MSVIREDSRDRKETILKELVLDAVGIEECGEILVSVDSILQSVKRGYEASQKGLCLFCAGFESRDREGNVEIYYNSPVMQTLRLDPYVRCCEECIQTVVCETPRVA